VELALPAPHAIDHVITMEDITRGERVRKYLLEGKVGAKWVQLASGTAIGHKKIDRIAPVEVSRVRLLCTESAAEPIIRKLAVYDTAAKSK